MLPFHLCSACSLPQCLRSKLVVTLVGLLHGRSRDQARCSPHCQVLGYNAGFDLYRRHNLTCCNGTCLHSLLALRLEIPHRESVALSTRFCHPRRLGVWRPSSDDPCTTISTYSISFSGLYVPSTTDGSSISRGRSVRYRVAHDHQLLTRVSAVCSILQHVVRLCQGQKPSVPFLARLLPD